MSIAAKVLNGTTPSANLCPTCTHSHIFQGEGQREYTRCGAFYETHAMFVPTLVVRCNKYHDKRDNTPSLREMGDMAFILTEDNPLHTVGFVSNREWKRKNKDNDPLPPGVKEF